MRRLRYSVAATLDGEDALASEAPIASAA